MSRENVERVLVKGGWQPRICIVREDLVLGRHWRWDAGDFNRA